MTQSGLRRRGSALGLIAVVILLVAMLGLLTALLNQARSAAQPTPTLVAMLAALTPTPGDGTTPAPQGPTCPEILGQPEPEPPESLIMRATGYPLADPAEAETLAARITSYPATVTAYYTACQLTPYQTPTPIGSPPTPNLTPAAGLPPGLIFVSDFTLWQVNADGLAETRGNVPVWDFLLSPDGEQIAYLHSGGLAVRDRAAIDLPLLNSGGGTRGPNAGIQWLAANAQIVLYKNLFFVDAYSNTTAPSLGYFRVDTGERVELTDDLSPYGSASLAPDGQQIAYLDRVGGLNLISLEGVTTPLAPELLAGGPIDFRAVAWSPDGQQLALQGVQPVGDSFSNVLVLMELHTGSLRELLHSDEGWAVDVADALSWSPDGAWIAFPEYWTTDFGGTSLYRTRFLRLSDGFTYRIEDGILAFWRSEGSAAVVARPFEMNVYQTLDLQTQTLTPILGLPQYASPIAWHEPARVLSPGATFMPTPSHTPSPTMTYLWPVVLPAGYWIDQAFFEPMFFSFTLRSLQPSASTGSVGLWITMRGGPGVMNSFPSVNLEEYPQVMVRGQNGWLIDLPAGERYLFWYEDGQPYVLIAAAAASSPEQLIDIANRAEALSFEGMQAWDADRRNTPQPPLP